MRHRLIAFAVILAIGAAGWWAHQRHASAVVMRAVLDDRAVWQAEAQRVRAEASQREINIQTRAVMAQMEADHAHAQRVAAIAAAASGARSERDRLRVALSQAVRGGGGGAGQGTGTERGSDAGPAIADALAACADRYADVAGVADRLAVQVTGLQAYVRDVVGGVCVASATE